MGLAVMCSVDQDGRFAIRPAACYRPVPVREVTFDGLINGPSSRWARHTRSVVRFPETEVKLVVDPEPSLTLEVQNWPSGASEVTCALTAGDVIAGQTPGPEVVMHGRCWKSISGEGRVFFPALSAALHYRAWVHLPEHDAYVLEEDLVAGEARTRTVPLRQGHEVSGRIVGISPGQRVIVSADGNANRSLHTGRSLHAVGKWDGGTSFVVRGLPPGEWVIRVRAQAAERTSGPEPVRLGRATVVAPARDVEVQLEPL